MRVLVWFFGLATAHRMMITFNCEGLSGFGRAVQNVPDECSDAIFYQAPIRLQQVKQLSKTNEAKSGLSLQYLAGSTDASIFSFDDLADLDGAIAKSLSDGQKVVLLGPEITLANTEPNLSEQNVKDIDRHPLQAKSSDSPTWDNIQSKGFPNCGIIKIGPKITITPKDAKEPTIVNLADAAQWTCSGGKFTIPTKEDPTKKLEISYKQKKSLADMIVSYGGVEYNGTDAKDLPYGSDKPVFSYACSKINLKSTTEQKISIGPYQIQPFCGADCKKFTVTVVDCVPLMGEMVWATFLGFLLFSSILAGAVWAMLAIESPTRFETARSKPLIIPDHSQ